MAGFGSFGSAARCGQRYSLLSCWKSVKKREEAASSLPALGFNRPVDGLYPSDHYGVLAEIVIR